MTNDKDNITIGGVTVFPGQRTLIDIPISPLYTRTPMNIAVHVINGKKPGPRMFITSAVHGDELNGVEIIRRLLKVTDLDRLKGTLIAVPIVNIFGFIYRSRYLPDRRDLNRSFPGSKQGSMAARMAHLILEEIVSHCTHGIDIHTGAIHRRNLPQVRANLKDPVALSMAKAFGAPVVIDGGIIHGSLRCQAVEQGVTTLLYEAGEALRMNEVAIRMGVKGVVNVMRSLKMLPPIKKKSKDVIKPFIAHSAIWIRADHSGLCVSPIRLGSEVEKDQPLAIIADPISGVEFPLLSPCKGIVIGVNKLPLVNEGDAILHIAKTTGTEMELVREANSGVSLSDDEATLIVE
jgi:uncharacterized protein